MLGTERILNQTFGVCLYLRPQRLAYQDRRVLSGRGLANAVTSYHHRFTRNDWLAYIQALAGYGTMVVTERSGL